MSTTERRNKMLVFAFIALIGLSESTVYNNQLRFSSYDYIVVGGGSAGSVVVNKLSECGDYTVLLLEAGGNPPQISEVPFFVAKLHNTEMEWQNFSEYQENACQGNPGGRCIWSRAKVLGGCSVHNYMCWVRGNRHDFDNWERRGCKGWNHDKALEVFKNIENHTDYKILNNGYHGSKGYQTVSPLTFKTKIGAAHIEALKHIGYDYIDDYNGPTQTGSSYIQLSQRDGIRCSAEKAFLRPVADKPNVDILTYAYALNITFDCEKRATGVFFDHQGETKYIPVNKEIILSAGAISSPLILMRSGIGPKEHLEELKIPVILDLPVGENLQDHPFSIHLNYAINESVGIVEKRDINPETISELLDKKGPLTSPGSIEVVGFINSKYQNASEDWPDIMLFGGSGLMFPFGGIDFSNRNGTSLAFLLMRPKSRGTVKLRSTDPYEDPIVDPRYFTDPDDIKRLIDGTKIIMSLVDTPALQRYSPELTPEILNGCEEFKLHSDEYIECALRHYVVGGFHMSGSCRMGNPSDNTTVVDPELRVKGVSGLRVADASIMPEITSGNLNAVCIMIGRKAADMILG